jgi:hypothetical protein
MRVTLADGQERLVVIPAGVLSGGTFQVAVPPETDRISMGMGQKPEASRDETNVH